MSQLATPVKDPWPFLLDQGEMSTLMRSKDWSRHPLGPQTHWHPVLKNTLGLMLSCRFPMFLWWGPELYCFYNDAYRPSLGKDGKHPGILGMPAEQAWPEIWPTIGPLIHDVMAGKGTTWSEDQLIPIERNGRMEDVYWTFSYSPVNDGSGAIAGVLVTCAETTEKVLVLNQLKESEHRVRRFFQQAPVAMALFRGPEHRVELINARVLELWGHTADAVLDRSLIDAMPELRGQGILELLEGVYVNGEAFEATERPVQLMRNGVLTTAYINFVYEPICDANGAVEGVMGMGVDVTGSVLARKQAEAGEARFRLLADSMPQFVWTGDAQGNLNFFNQAVYDFSGLSETAITTDGWLQIVHPEEREGNAEAWLRSVRTGEPFLFEHRFLRHDGEYRWQLSRATPMYDPDGTVRMWVGTSTDIQDIKTDQQQKDYFISMASHELRNPLATLKGYIEVLKMEYANTAEPLLKKALDVMDKQVVDLASLVSDMLDLSKIRSGMLELHREEFSMVELVRSVIDGTERAHPDHAIILKAPSDVLVKADRNRIAQVLNNLLSNAVKYAPASDSVEVTVTATDTDVMVLVRDHGIGISTMDQERIFQRFFRVEGGRENNFSGLGIGLYICSDIIERHHGRIGVTSAPGEGSTFHFALPLA